MLRPERRSIVTILRKNIEFIRKLSIMKINRLIQNERNTFKLLNRFVKNKAVLKNKEGKHENQ